MTETSISLPPASKLAPIPALVLKSVTCAFRSVGRSFGVMTADYASAVAVAYCPFQAQTNRPRLHADEDLEGRDPNW